MDIQKQLLLYAVTMETDALANKVEQALLGGVTLVQLREKRLRGDALLKTAMDIRAVCDRFNVPLIINDDAKLALACGAAGVHLGQGDFPAKEARAMLGKGKLIGVTARTAELAKRAEADGADYIGAGAVFLTSTKRDAVPLALDALKEICDSVKIPVVAIGGIGTDNILTLKGTHIAGVAAVSSIFGAADVRSAAQNLLALAKEAVNA